MHYAGTMADSNAYILKIDGTTTRSVCSIGVACSSALSGNLEQKIGVMSLLACRQSC